VVEGAETGAGTGAAGLGAGTEADRWMSDALPKSQSRKRGSKSEPTRSSISVCTRPESVSTDKGVRVLPLQELAVFHDGEWWELTLVAAVGYLCVSMRVPHRMNFDIPMRTVIYSAMTLSRSLARLARRLSG
jgi:hypothetical protein